MKIRAEFTEDTGAVMVVTFDDATKTYVDDAGRNGSYAPNIADQSMEIMGPGFRVEVKYDGPFVPQAGVSTRYRASDGRTGVAKVLSVE